MLQKNQPFDFQALVRDYGWDVAERVAADWSRVQRSEFRKLVDVHSSWRKVFRSTEGARD